MIDKAERYEKIFRFSPVPMWEQDMTQLIAVIDEVRDSGVTDFARYLDEHPEVVYQWANKIRILDVNHSSIRMMGVKDVAEFLTSIDTFFEADTFPVFKAQLISIANGEQYFESEVGIRNLAGRRIHTLMTITMLEERERSLIAMVDISERQRMEQELRATNVELGRSNNELEEYAYVVSHDLQEPLRTISSYMDIFAKRYRDRFDERAAKYIDTITRGANRMRALISDLLQFSRIGHGEQVTQESDLSEILREVLGGLAATIGEQGAEITHDDLPTVRGAKVELTLVLQNLLSNGLKFQRPDVTPKLHVSAEKSGGEWKIGIRDNGVGIAPENIDAVFSIFKRVHSKSEYPGTGIGLAIVKKIIERHGGRVWVESELGSGSTFYLTLPAHDA